MTSLVPGESLRVLLVSVSEQARDQVGAALTGRIGSHRLYWVSQPDLASVRAGDLLPHVILVDDELGGALPAMLIGQLIARVPQAKILALVRNDSINGAREAVLAGARAFVTKPVQTDDLVNALRQVLTVRGIGRETDDAAMTSRIIVFCAPKGGTGRSIVAINTAIAIHRLSRQPVVMVDADFRSPALDVALNLDASRTIADLLPKLATLDSELLASTLATHVCGIRVLLAPSHAGSIPAISLPQVQQIMAWLKRSFSWVIVDLGLPLDETAFAFLDGADRVVMTVMPEIVGLRNARLMLEELQAHGYPSEKVWLVLNRATMRGGISAHDIEDRLQLQIKAQIPDDQPLATHSINRGVPLITSHRDSAVAKAIQQFAGKLLAEMPAGETEALRSSANRLLTKIWQRRG